MIEKPKITYNKIVKNNLWLNNLKQPTIAYDKFYLKNYGKYLRITNNKKQ